MYSSKTQYMYHRMPAAFLASLSSPPFMPQECQELMTLLKTFSSDSVSVVHTRIVARVILRVGKYSHLPLRIDATNI